MDSFVSPFWMWRVGLPMLLFVACGRPTPPTPVAAASIDAAPTTTSAPADSGGVRELATLFGTLSEPERGFLTDNWVSNETSYLDVAPELRARTGGGAYIGVGPEQNFSYIALSKPDIAFIVDIRKGNAIEHLFYKAVFELAENRDDFKALLVGGLTPKIRSRIAVPLDADDERSLATIAREFQTKGMEIRFEMHEKNGRTYPTLQSLLSDKDSFLSSDDAFAFVQKMEREDRIVPVVGDFAGPHALRAIGAELRKRKLSVSTFYVSNVEQYVMQDKKWNAWVENVRALPADDKSIFVRCYLDQGKPHPRQKPGHRTATVTQPFSRFFAKNWASWFALASDL